MAKSQIIKDLANGAVDTQTALKRAKVLLQDLNNQNLLDWINYEIGGYPDDVEVPEYRVISGQLYGSYMKGSIATHIKYNDVVLPLGKMPSEQQDKLLMCPMRISISALADMICKDKDSQGFVKNIPADYYPYIAKYNNDPYMVIYSAYVKLNMPQVRDIFAQVESMLLDILAYLEKNFGNLDDLDIDIESKTDVELDEIIKHLLVIIHFDNSV
ncbi:MAG: hypothetical protein LIO94_07555, partial [Clostridiales bacterium]|nr:hypothetical protein [Clostridiales bacterium]